MKATLLALAFFGLITTATAQSSKFNGDWSGKITTEEGSLWIRIKIDNNNIVQYFFDDDENVWSPVSPALSRNNANKNNLLYFWMNNSSVWSETQTYALSYVNKNKIYVTWSRQVNNIKEDEGNSVWSVNGTGYLTRR